MKTFKHIFIFGACGRCSSTALQRILNSSDEVCIWGEQHYLMDEMIEIIGRIDYFSKDINVINDIGFLRKCFEHNTHFFPYMNAIGNLDSFRTGLISAICENLRPTKNYIKRFGFKDIRLKSINTLLGLRRIFPQCCFVFLFRNPTNQWPSVNHHKYWDYSDDLNLFLDEYYRISNIFMQFNQTQENCIFLENTSIDDLTIFQNILNFLDISKIDQKMVNQKYFTKTIRNQQINESIKLKIINHPSFKNYEKMKKLQIQ